MGGIFASEIWWAYFREGLHCIFIRILRSFELTGQVQIYDLVYD